MKATPSSDLSAMRTSSLVLNRMAKAKKPSAVFEKLMLPAAKDICHELSGEVEIQKLAHVLHLTSTISKQIDEITEDTEAQLLDRITESLWYSIQFDKSTNDDNKATKLVFMAYIFQEDVHEDMLCVLLLPTPRLQKYSSP